MRRFLPVALAALLLAGCATGRKLPDYEKPLVRSPVQQVRTTAYTHTEADHIKHGRKTAAGTTLRRGEVNSAAADWSRWPLGTKFHLLETGEIYEVDDYGWALAGTNTIDLYQPSRGHMNRWGVRRVTIEILEWGDPGRSYALLKQRDKHRHVKRMVRQLEDRYAL
jgi:3D (Asp-Asp-Asp) domain-containing protein